MRFNKELFKELLVAIEYRLNFSLEGIKEPQCFDIECNINISEVFDTLNKTSARYKLDEYKYCLAILYQFDYIHMLNGVIDRITPEGFKFMLYTLYGLECKY